MKFPVTYSFVPALLASLVAAQADCATDVNAAESVLSCLNTLNLDYTTQTTDTVALFSSACSWVKAAIGCEKSYCGSGYSGAVDLSSQSVEWCNGGAAQATPTPTSTPSTSGTKASAASSATVAAAKSTAGVGSNGVTDQAVLLAAAVGIVGAVL